MSTDLQALCRALVHGFDTMERVWLVCRLVAKCVAIVLINVALLTACGGGGDDTPTPYDECVAAQVGPQLPGVPVFACLALEGAPRP